MLASCHPPISVLPASWWATLDVAEQPRHQVHRQVQKQVSLAAEVARLAVLPSSQVVGVRTKMESPEMHNTYISKIQYQIWFNEYSQITIDKKF